MEFRCHDYGILKLFIAVYSIAPCRFHHHLQITISIQFVKYEHFVGFFWVVRPVTENRYTHCLLFMRVMNWAYVHRRKYFDEKDDISLRFAQGKRENHCLFNSKYLSVFTYLFVLLLFLVGCRSTEAVVTETPALSATPTLPIGVSLVTRAVPTTAVIQTTPSPLPTVTTTPTATPIVYTIVEGDTLRHGQNCCKSDRR